MSGTEKSTTSWTEHLWYGKSVWSNLLSPLSFLYGLIAKRRRATFNDPSLRWNASVPVIVVGNINVGGTGKTPLVVWLTEWLQSRGNRVGIVSRGYGGKGCQYPLLVEANTPTKIAGDEPVLLATRCLVPVIIDPHRVRATTALTKQHDVDVVLSDDGLQHYELGRAVEIVVVDGTRGVGNGRLLPAGPLREPIKRLEEVDWVVSNTRPSGLVDNETVMKIVPIEFVNLADHRTLSISEFKAEFGTDIRAIAAIGNPNRFFSTMKELGFTPECRAFRDHYVFKPKDLSLSDKVIVVTEKDSFRFNSTSIKLDGIWFLRVDIQFNGEVDTTLKKLFKPHGIKTELLA